MDRKEWRKKFARAQEQFIRELMDGCNDCQTDGFLCRIHRPIGFLATEEPRQCQEFQAFLKEMGLIKGEGHALQKRP